MTGLFWFRTDLRIFDNAALADAMNGCEQLIAVYILTPETWKAHSVAPCKIRFLLANLTILSNDLWKLGIPLLIRKVPHFSDCPKLLSKLCQKYNIDEVYFSKEYLLDEQQRDNAVSRELLQQVTINTYDTQLVMSPGTVLSKQRTPLKVFTPFKKTWLEKVRQLNSWRVTKKSNKLFKSEVEPDHVPSRLQYFSHQKISVSWEAGEHAALKKLTQFCKQALSDYHLNRDIPSVDGTSSLSPYLAQGVLSPRQCITAALQACNYNEIDRIHANEGMATWISELIWREFYYHIAYHYPDVCRHKPFRLKTDNLPWRNDNELLSAWKNGMTGFPIVDAGMRQLLQTGWMHNRLRMITAMFLSKILLLDWRLGEMHFMTHLIDGDFASNNGGWQWCASTGTDAVPYFRIFNPTTQSQRFDASGDFIRKFCPELSHLDNKIIHAPYAFGIKPQELNYPEPIVDYKAMRNKTIELFKKL